MHVQADNLDRRVTIQSRTLAQNDYGQPTETWATFATRWASKRDVTGREFFAAGQEIAEKGTVFRIRYLSGVKTEMRLVSEGVTYNIRHTAEIGRRDALDIVCEATVE